MRSGRPVRVDLGGTGVTRGVMDLCFSFSNSMTSSSVTGFAVEREREREIGIREIERWKLNVKKNKHWTKLKSNSKRQKSKVKC